jgi:TolA-binding protein
MSQQIKIIAYVVLLSFAAWFGYGFFRNITAASAMNAGLLDPTNQLSQVTPTSTNDDEPVVSAVTNQATNGLSSTNQPVDAKPKTKISAPPSSRGQRTSSAMAYGGGLLVTIVCLGLLVAHDFSGFAAHRFEKLIFDEDLEGVKDPEYEEAEKVWANGNFLEAIQLMRDYLKSHPREQYAALRIAEIYEKDLGNFLAAALEYEEIIKKKLPPERWGWAAIHLANLYSGKLNKSQHAVDLLQRIVAEYGQTAAARKARERLVAEGIEVPEPLSEEGSPSDPPSNLPPGFTPRKS